MKTFIELATEIKKSIDKEDTNVLASIANSVELSAVATTPHALGSYLIYDKKVYEVTTAISVGDTLVIYPATGYNIKVADDIMTMLEDEAATRSAMGAKNKEPFDIDVAKALNTTGTWTGNSYELNGITFAFADDGKVTVSGTASALCSINISGNYDLNGDYIITGCPSGGGGSTYSLRIYDSSSTVVADDVGEGISFTANNLANCRTNLVVRKDAAISTPIVFAPMIRDSKDTDPTYQPYAKTNQKLTADSQVAAGNDDAMLNVLGAKNLLPITATTQVINGVTYTVRDNSTANYYLRGTVRAVRSSTSSDNAWLTLVEDLVLPSGSYILSGCPSGGSTASYLLAFDTDIQTTTLYESGDGLAFTVTDNEKIRVRIRCAPTFDGNVTFYPMIRPATVADATYVPYAKTNRQIVANDKAKTTIAYSDSYVTIEDTYSGYVVKNGWVFWQFRFKTTDTSAHEVGLILPPNAFGDYIYVSGQYTGASGNENRIEVRINRSGSVRFHNYTEAETWVVVNGCYPMAE